MDSPSKYAENAPRLPITMICSISQSFCRAVPAWQSGNFQPAARASTRGHLELIDLLGRTDGVTALAASLIARVVMNAAVAALCEGHVRESYRQGSGGSRVCGPFPRSCAREGQGTRETRSQRPLQAITRDCGGRRTVLNGWQFGPRCRTDVRIRRWIFERGFGLHGVYACETSTPDCLRECAKG